MKKKALKKYLISCLSSVLLVSQTVGLVSTVTVSAVTQSAESTSILKAENLVFNGEESAAINNSKSLQTKLNDIKNLQSGTITVRYKLDSIDDTIVSLFSVSVPGSQKEYASAYIKPKTGEIGVEFQGTTNGKASVKLAKIEDINNTNLHTVSYVFDGDRIAFYFDGELLGQGTLDGMYKDLTWISNATTVTVGGVQRKFQDSGKNETFVWPLKGTIDLVEVRNEVASESYISNAHSETAKNSKNSIINVKNLEFNGEKDNAIANSESIQEKVEEIKNLRKGTITARYNLSDTSAQIVSLFSISIPEYEQSYASAYIKPADGKIGIEFKKENKVSKSVEYQFTDKANKINNDWHTVSYSFTGEEIILYFDGVEVKKEKLEGMYSDLPWIKDGKKINLTIGGLERKGENNNFQWAFNGSIDLLDVTDEVATKDYISEIHSVTSNDYTNGIVHLENLSFDGSKEKAIKNNESLKYKVNKIKTLDNGTITARYKLSSALDKMEELSSLFSVSVSENQQSYAIAYIKPKTGVIGIEFKNNQSNKKIEHVLENKEDAINNNWHTVSYSFTGEEIVLYFDGKEVKREALEGMYSNLSWIAEADNITVGGAQRVYEDGNKKEDFQWPFKGTINLIEVSENVEDTYIKALHEATIDTYKQEKSYIWQQNSDGIYSYRIPSLVKNSEGELVIVADARKMHYNDWGDIKTVVKTSDNLGKSWSNSITVVDTPTQPYYTKKVIEAKSDTTSSISIDPSLLAADKNVVYMLVDVMPESRGPWYNWGGNNIGYLGGAYNSKVGSGYVKVGTENYLKLFGEAKDEYYVKPEDGVGVVYKFKNDDGTTLSKAEKTNYRVSYGTETNNFDDYGDLYNNGEIGDKEAYVGNIYLTNDTSVNPDLVKGPNIAQEENRKGELRVLVTNYLWLFKSENGGETWGAPTDITPQVKEDWMKFIGAGAGVGSQIQHNGKSRLIFPIYYTNGNGDGIGIQSSAIIYSDDGGQTWKRSKSPNDGRVVNGKTIESKTVNKADIDYELTENQVVQLNNGTLLQFMRNTSKDQMVRASKSTNGGATWSTELINTGLRDIYCQLSVITVDHNNKEYIVFANPTGDGPSNSSSRKRGMIRVGEVEGDNITWLTSKVVEDGNFAYSSLVDLGGGEVGLAYEDQGGISYLTYNIDQLIKENAQDANVTIKEVKRIDEVSKVETGNEILLQVKMNQPVIIEGDRQLAMNIGGVSRVADYVSGSGTDTLVFSYKVAIDDAGKFLINGFTNYTTVVNQYLWKASAPTNSIQLDEFRDIAYGELSHVFNGDFNKESNWEGKNKDVEYETKDGDNYYGTIKSGYSDDYLIQTIDVEAGAKYKLTANVKVDSDEDVPGLFLVVKYGLKENLEQVEIKNAKNAWGEFEVDFVPKSGRDKVIVGIMKYAVGDNEQKCADATLHIDNVKVVQQKFSEEKELWKDEFNTLDTNIWGYELGRVRGNEQQHYVDSKDNVFIDEGKLTLKVTEREDKYQYTNSGGHNEPREIIYNSGSVRTIGQKEFLYGRIEMKAKLPEGKGAFPAFWTLGADFSLDGLINGDQATGWPTTGEIDIMEIIGAPNGEHPGEEKEGNQSNKTVYGTPHFYWKDSPDGTKDGNEPKGIGGNATFRENLSKDFHVYGINWTEEKIEWYVDNEIYNVIYFTDLTDAQLQAAKASLCRPQYIQLNLATGGNWAKNAGEYLATDDTRFVIDWVRWTQDGEQAAASSEYYEDVPTLNSTLEENERNITLVKGNDITKEKLLEYVSLDDSNTGEKYEVRFSIEDEFMFVNNDINKATNTGQTKVSKIYSSTASTTEGVLENLNELEVGVYNIHYTAVPVGTTADISQHHTANKKLVRKTLKLVILPNALEGTSGQTLSNVELPNNNWAWKDENEKIVDGKSYKAIYKTTKNEKPRETEFTLPITIK